MQDSRAAPTSEAPCRPLRPLARRLDADQLDLIVDEGIENADRVGASADTGDHEPAAVLGSRACFGLVADHPLEVADQHRIGRRTDHEPMM